MLHQALSHSRHCKIAEPCGHQLSEGTEHALESLRLETSCLLQSRPLREVDGHSVFLLLHAARSPLLFSASCILKRQTQRGQRQAAAHKNYSSLVQRKKARVRQKMTNIQRRFLSCSPRSERALQEARLHYTAQENDVPTLAAPMPPAALFP